MSLVKHKLAVHLGEKGDIIYTWDIFKLKQGLDDWGTIAHATRLIFYTSATRVVHICILSSKPRWNFWNGFGINRFSWPCHTCTGSTQKASSTGWILIQCTKLDLQGFTKFFRSTLKKFLPFLKFKVVLQNHILSSNVFFSCFFLALISIITKMTKNIILSWTNRPLLS